MNHIAIFASGSGTNAENLIKYFEDHPSIRVSLVVTNRPDAGVIIRAENLGVPVLVFTNAQMENATFLIDVLKEYDVSFIVLAGFLRKIPVDLIENFENRIINIHPSLLPKYGGKGMYGMKVHEAVVAAGEKETGITIHLVNEEYDRGKKLAAYTTLISPDMTAKDIAAAVHQLEYSHFPAIVEEYITHF
ncbi:MAG: phosphoribosylglycinamide formyltransferase [Saprospiraceae bacterium]|nr:phosphoribosylglycinamide formyltransferase [Saprospiraceae bacterium]